MLESLFGVFEETGHLSGCSQTSSFLLLLLLQTTWHGFFACFPKEIRSNENSEYVYGFICSSASSEVLLKSRAICIKFDSGWRSQRDYMLNSFAKTEVWTGETVTHHQRKACRTRSPHVPLNLLGALRKESMELLWLIYWRQQFCALEQVKRQKDVQYIKTGIKSKMGRFIKSKMLANLEYCVEFSLKHQERYREKQWTDWRSGIASLKKKSVWIHLNVLIWKKIVKERECDNGQKIYCNRESEFYVSYSIRFRCPEWNFQAINLKETKESMFSLELQL